MSYNHLCDNFLSDFTTAFPDEGRADIIAVEQFLQKYKHLIERCTDLTIPELDPYKCVDFKRRIQTCKTICQVAKEYIIAERDVTNMLLSVGLQFSRTDNAHCGIIPPF